MSTFTLRRARELREQQQKEQVEIVEEVVEKIEEPIEEVKEDVFVCPHCSREYKTKRGLDKHIATKHKDGE